MWGSRNRRSGSSSSSYDDDYSSSYSSDDKDIFYYKDEVESTCGFYFDCDNVKLDSISSYVAGDKIYVTFNLIVYPGAQQWQINRAVEKSVKSAANATGCPYSISYSAHLSDY